MCLKTGIHFFKNPSLISKCIFFRFVEFDSEGPSSYRDYKKKFKTKYCKKIRKTQIEIQMKTKKASNKIFII